VGYLFCVNPKRALLSNINKDLIDLYRGIKYFPEGVWKIFKNFLENKKAYYEIRKLSPKKGDLAFSSAGLL
jgi:DNA adenine methylase